MSSLLTIVGNFEEDEEEEAGEDEEMNEKGQEASKAAKKVRKGESVAKAPLKSVIQAFSSKLAQVHEIKNLVTKTTEVK